MRLIQQTLSSKKNLDTIISLKPSTNPYGIWYRVTDTKEDLVYSVMWKLYIQTSYGEGLLVLDTKDDATTDISLIMGEDFTEKYDKDNPTTMHHLYSLHNEKGIDGLVNSTCFEHVKQQNRKTLYTITNNSLMAIDLLDFSTVGKNLDLSFDDELIFKPTQLNNQGTMILFINNGEIRFFRTKITVSVSGDFTVDKYVSIFRETGGGSPRLVFYDKKNQSFKKSDGTISAKTKISAFTYNASADPFDPNNVPNVETLKANIGPSGNHYFVMRNKTTGKVQIYVLGNPGAKKLYDISSPGLEEAIDFVICENQEVVYFATKNKIYAILLAGATPRVELKYTMPAGEEITHIDMFRQAWYLISPQTYVSGVGYKVPMDSHEMLLLVGSYSPANKGKLYTIPLTGINTGNIDEANIKSYGGFDKIIGTVAQE